MSGGDREGVCARGKKQDVYLGVKRAKVRGTAYVCLGMCVHWSIEGDSQIERRFMGELGRILINLSGTPPPSITLIKRMLSCTHVKKQICIPAGLRTSCWPILYVTLHLFQ